MKVPLLGWTKAPRSLWAWLPAVKQVESALFPWPWPYPPTLVIDLGE